ncbi:hypothetical protein PTKIN_Ptkin11bG0023300 [Pterospermum kingtungense]
MDRSLDDLMDDLILEGNDDEELELDSCAIDQTADRIDLCLMGRFLTDRSINFMAMRSHMVEIWHPVKGIHVKDLNPNLFLFQFFHEIDLQRVLEGGPWVFDNCPLVYKRLQEDDIPTKIKCEWGPELRATVRKLSIKGGDRWLRRMDGSVFSVGGGGEEELTSIASHMEIGCQGDFLGMSKRKDVVLHDKSICMNSRIVEGVLLLQRDKSKVDKMNPIRPLNEDGVSLDLGATGDRKRRRAGPSEEAHVKLMDLDPDNLVCEQQQKGVQEGVGSKNDLAAGPSSQACRDK